MVTEHRVLIKHPSVELSISSVHIPRDKKESPISARRGHIGQFPVPVTKYQVQTSDEEVYSCADWGTGNSNGKKPLGSITSGQRQQWWMLPLYTQVILSGAQSRGSQKHLACCKRYTNLEKMHKVKHRHQ